MREPCRFGAPQVTYVRYRCKQFVVHPAAKTAVELSYCRPCIVIDSIAVVAESVSVLRYAVRSSLGTYRTARIGSIPLGIASPVVTQHKVMVIRYIPVYTRQHLGIGLVSTGEVITACIISVCLQRIAELFHVLGRNAACHACSIGHTIF